MHLYFTPLTLALLLRGKVKKRTQNTAAQFLPMGPCPLVKTNGTLPIGKDQWVRTALRQSFFFKLCSFRVRQRRTGIEHKLKVYVAPKPLTYILRCVFSGETVFGSVPLFKRSQNAKYSTEHKCLALYFAFLILNATKYSPTNFIDFKKGKPCLWKA